MRNILIVGIGVLSACIVPATLKAGDQAAPVSATTESSAGTRYGLFNGLDHRSMYGVGVFPEPFLVDDSDLEPNEFRLDWLHPRAPGQNSDSGKVELEKGLGQMTLKMEVPCEHTMADGDTAKGFDNVNLGARY